MANWIAKATSKHKGSFRAAAKKHGLSTHAYAEKKKESGGTVGKRARLALTLMHLGGRHG